LIDAPPGRGPKLHEHPYEEVFIVQEGTVTFTAGDDLVEAKGGQVVVVPAGVPHKFVNSGVGRIPKPSAATSTTSSGGGTRRGRTL
jgi:mannose-6-phosphate isomerase-like protein (cupin superfamily)